MPGRWRRFCPTTESKRVLDERPVRFFSGGFAQRACVFDPARYSKPGRCGLRLFFAIRLRQGEMPIRAWERRRANNFQRIARRM